MIQFDLPQNNPSNIIKVIGVGGGGGNAVNYMYNLGIDGVDFVVCNTDKKALNNSPVPVKVQLGPSLTQGLGAGAQPEIGQKACMESISEIENLLSDNTKMVFVTAGMGGGTGTGGAPIVAQTAKNLGILTVGIVTTPFSYEGRKRIRQADEGIEALRKNVDTILVISNDKLRQQFGNIATSQAFNRADDILATATKCITDVINSQGHIVVDFADVSTVMRDGGVAILGNATAAGENRAYEAAEQALNSPLLNDSNIHGAKWVLLNINSAHGVHEHTLDEVEMIQAYIQEQAGEDCDVIFGTGFDDNLGENISVTIIATGFEYKQIQDAYSSERKTPKADSNRITLKLGEAGEEHKLFGNPTEEQVQNTPPVNQIMDIVQTEIEAPAIPNYMAIGLGMSRIAATAVPVQEEVQDFMYEEKVIDTLGFTTEFELPEYHAMAEDIPTSVYEEEWVIESTDALPLADTEMAIPDESTEEIPAEEPFMESLAVLEEEPEVVALSEETAETLEEEPKLIFELSIETEEPSSKEVNVQEELDALFEKQEGQATPAPMQIVEKTEQEMQDDYVTIKGITLNRRKGSRLLTETELEAEANFELQKRAFDERAARLRSMSFQVHQSGLDPDDDNIPAYMRQNKVLDEHPSSADDVYSGINVQPGQGGQSTISTLNTFLNGKRPD